MVKIVIALYFFGCILRLIFLCVTVTNTLSLMFDTFLNNLEQIFVHISNELFSGSSRLPQTKNKFVNFISCCKPAYIFEQLVENLINVLRLKTKLTKPTFKLFSPCKKALLDVSMAVLNWGQRYWVPWALLTLTLYKFHNKIICLK